MLRSISVWKYCNSTAPSRGAVHKPKGEFWYKCELKVLQLFNLDHLEGVFFFFFHQVSAEETDNNWPFISWKHPRFLSLTWINNILLQPHWLGVCVCLCVCCDHWGNSCTDPQNLKIWPLPGREKGKKNPASHKCTYKPSHNQLQYSWLHCLLQVKTHSFFSFLFFF